MAPASARTSRRRSALIVVALLLLAGTASTAPRLESASWRLAGGSFAAATRAVAYDGGSLAEGQLVLGTAASGPGTTAEVGLWSLFARSLPFVPAAGPVTTLALAVILATAGVGLARRRA